MGKTERKEKKRKKNPTLFCTNETIQQKIDMIAQESVYKSKSVRVCPHKQCTCMPPPLSSFGEKRRCMTFRSFTWDHVFELPYCTTQKLFRVLTESEKVKDVKRRTPASDEAQKPFCCS